MILDHYDRTLHETLIAIIELHEFVMIRIMFRVFITIHSVSNEPNAQFMSRLFMFTIL